MSAGYPVAPIRKSFGWRLPTGRDATCLHRTRTSTIWRILTCSRSTRRLARCILRPQDHLLVRRAAERAAQGACVEAMPVDEAAQCHGAAGRRAHARSVGFRGKGRAAIGLDAQSQAGLGRISLGLRAPLFTPKCPSIASTTLSPRFPASKGVIQWVKRSNGMTKKGVVWDTLTPPLFGEGSGTHSANIRRKSSCRGLTITYRW